MNGVTTTTTSYKVETKALVRSVWAAPLARSLLLLTLLFVAQQGAAQDNTNNTAVRAMRDLTKRSASQIGRVDNPLAQQLFIPPLLREEGHNDAAREEEKFGSNKTYGPNTEDKVQMLFPPLVEMQRLADSEAVQGMLKELITKRQPVMAQTFYMVENGAASGYFQAMNTVSNTLSNIIQANDFQLKVMDLTDPEGDMKHTWISNVFDHSTGNNGREKQGWAAALMAAQGDKTNFNGRAGSGAAGAQDIPFRALPAPTPFDFETINRGAQNGPEKEKVLLSTLLFKGGNKGRRGRNEEFDNRPDDITRLVTSFTEMVGDVELSLAQPNGQNSEGRSVKTKRIPPLRGDQISGSNAGTRRGILRLQYEETTLAWENLHKLLKKVCEFKKENPNLQKMSSTRIEELETLSTITTITTEDWENASAPDIPMSIDVLQMVFKLFEKEKLSSELDCNELNATRESMPTSFDALRAANLDDCGQDGSGGCLRNRLVLTLSYLLGRSRMLHSYAILENSARRFITSKSQAIMVDRVFQDVYSSLDPLEAVRSNRARWNEVMTFFSQYTQGRIGGSPHSGSTSNVTQLDQGRR